jgi:hypothetical protein
MSNLFDILKDNPPLIKSLFRFTLAAAAVKNDILLTQPSDNPSDNPPAVLPPSIINLLSRMCDLPAHMIESLWDSTKVAIWHEDEFSKPAETREAMFREHGEDMGFRACCFSLLVQLLICYEHSIFAYFVPPST